jgi:hypothetical protein
MASIGWPAISPKVVKEVIDPSRFLEISLLDRSVNLTEVCFMVSIMTDIVKKQLIPASLIGSIMNQKSIAISHDTFNTVKEMGDCIKNKKRRFKNFIEEGRKICVL